MKCVAFLGFFLAIFAQSDFYAQIPTNREDGLRMLKGCSTRPVTQNCNEDTAGYLVGLYEHGDRSLLRPLLDAGLRSDGALSELLGDFYSDVLSARPRSFLYSELTIA